MTLPRPDSLLNLVQNIGLINGGKRDSCFAVYMLWESGLQSDFVILEWHIIEGARHPG